MMKAMAAATAALVIASGAACGTSQPETAETSTGTTAERPTWPELLDDFRFHWSADPGIDLTAGVAVPIRAYLESYDVASYTLDLDDVYPGFMRATPQNDELDGDYQTQLAFIRPLNGLRSDEKPAKPFGYTTFHILRVEPIDGGGQRATVCAGSYANYVESRTDPGTYVSVVAAPDTATLARPSDTVGVYRIELSENDPRAVPDPPPVTEPQQGPAPAPIADVFGKWFVSAASSSYWGPINDKALREEFPSPELRQECAERMPDPPEVQVEMATGFKTETPPPGEAIPGWPE